MTCKSIPRNWLPGWPWTWLGLLIPVNLHFRYRQLGPIPILLNLPQKHWTVDTVNYTLLCTLLLSYSPTLLLSYSPTLLLSSQTRWGPAESSKDVNVGDKIESSWLDGGRSEFAFLSNKLSYWRSLVSRRNIYFWNFYFYTPHTTH